MADEVKRYRLRSIMHKNGIEKEMGVVLDSTGRLKDWLIIRVSGTMRPSIVQSFRKHCIKAFGEKTMVLCSDEDIDFCVFEEVPDDEHGD